MRLGFLKRVDGERVAESYAELIAKLNALMNSLGRRTMNLNSTPKAESREPRAQSLEPRA